MSNKRKRTKNHKQNQIFRPISWLPKVAEIIDGSYYDLLEQQKSFAEATKKPHVMDETNEAMLNTLALCYSGFGRYGELLSNLAGAIKSGDIEVPKH